MQIPDSTLEKMTVASKQKPRRRFWQFSLAALFAVMTFSCVAAYAGRPLLSRLQQWLSARDQTIATDVDGPIPMMLPEIDNCPGCGMG